MTRLIVICGLPGTGKTALATELSRRLKIFCIHKDSVKESLYDSLKLSTLEDSKRVGYPAVKAALDLAEENIANEIDVILESPFNFPEEGKLFEAWKEKYQLDLYVFVLQVNETERKRRFTEREGTKERHHSHQDTDRMRQYAEERCSYEHMPEGKIFLNSERPVEELVEKVLKYFS